MVVSCRSIATMLRKIMYRCLTNFEFFHLVDLVANENYLKVRRATHTSRTYVKRAFLILAFDFILCFRRSAI